MKKGFSSIISGIKDVAYETGFNVIIYQSNEMADCEKANLKTLLASQVDRILILFSK
jgi:LacI family transcriptional regulator